MLKSTRGRCVPAAATGLTTATFVVSMAVSAALSAAPAGAVEIQAGGATVQPASVMPHANSHWYSCNSSAVGSAPEVLWTRIQQATEADHSIPASFWSTQGYRQDIVKLVCYESTFDYRAQNVGQYGWYQMSQGLIASEGVTFYNYWNGNRYHAAGWYQCTAGELYMLHRYGNPAAAWQHEEVYGWY